MGASTTLRAALKKRLVAFVEERGFSVDYTDQPISTTFRRRSGDVAQVFDVQWDKAGRPRFVVNCGMSSLRDVPEEMKEKLVRDLRPFAADQSGRLYRRRGLFLGDWFRLDIPILKRLFLFRSYYEPETIVEEFLQLFPEMEAWWSAGVVGPHMRIHISYANQANQRPERNAGATSPSTSTPPSGVAHP